MDFHPTYHGTASLILETNMNVHPTHHGTASLVLETSQVGVSIHGNDQDGCDELIQDLTTLADRPRRR